MKPNLSTQDKRFANFLCDFPMEHSVPIYFGNPTRHDSKINNGTATLLKRGGRLFVATNHHVVSKFFERRETEEGVTLQVGGLNVESITKRIVLHDSAIDVTVMEFSDHAESDFEMLGNVRTRFFELGEIQPPFNKGSVVAFGGYPGVFRIRVDTNEVNFHTLSSGASVVHTASDRNIIVSIDHDESNITSLSSVAPPPDIAGMSGGPVFEISQRASITTFRFAGIIAECNENLKVMIAKPVGLFAGAFERGVAEQ